MMVAKRFSDDGVGRVVAGLANIASAAWDWTVVIAANLNEPLPGSLTGIDNIRCEELGGGGTQRNLLRRRKRLASLVKSYSPAIIHSHGRFSSLLTLLATGSRPHVSTFHADRIYLPHPPWFDRWPLRHLLPTWGRSIHILSEDIRTYFLQRLHVRQGRLVVMPNFVDDTLYTPRSTTTSILQRQALGIDTDRCVIAFVGRMHREKRPHYVVRALADTAAERPDLHAILAGDGQELAALKTLASTLGVADRITFTGRIDPRIAYTVSDVLALPSQREGFGLVCAEAMLSGIPVIRSRTGGCASQIIEGVTGWSFDTDDYASFLELVATLPPRETLAALGRNARRHAETHFTPAAVEPTLRSIYARHLPASPSMFPHAVERP